MDNWMELTEEQTAKRSWLAKGGSGWGEVGPPAPTGIPSGAAEPPAAEIAGFGFGPAGAEAEAAAATLAEECGQGVQQACAALSKEDEAKQAWMAQADAQSRRARLAEECALGVEDACVELSNEAPLTMGVQERQQRESAAAAYYNAQSVALPADNDEVFEEVVSRTAESEAVAEAEAIGAWSAGLSFEPLRLSREEAARQAFAGGSARSPPGAYTIEELAGMASPPAAPVAPVAPAAPVVEQAAPTAARSAAARAEMRAPPAAPIAAVAAAVVAVEAAASAAGLAVEAVAAAQAAEQAAEAEARAAAAQAVNEAEAARQQAVGAAASWHQDFVTAAAAAVAMPAAAGAPAVAAPPPNTREDEAKRAWLSNQGGVSAEVEVAALEEECDQGVEAACAAMSPEALAKRAWLARQVEDLQGQVEQLQGRGR